MKIPLTILAIVVLILAVFQLFAPPPDPESLKPRTDLPWQITVREDGSSRVFDLDLGHATLADAVAKFGPPEGIAVFEPKAGRLALEAYFGNVQFGPLKAKVLVALEAGEAELVALKQAALDRQGSPSGDWKYPLGDGVAQHADRKLSVITYIPGTRGLDPDFFRERFGEPAATLQENAQVQSWFYPEKGLSILIDEKAREVLEYQPPRKFVLPAGVTPNPKAG